MKSIPVLVAVFFIGASVAVSQELGGGGHFDPPSFGGGSVPHGDPPGGIAVRVGGGVQGSYLPDPQGGPQGGRRMGGGNPEIRRQLEQIKIWQMTKEMSLPTDKAEKFFPLYNHYNDEMRAITNERKATIMSLDSAVGSHAGESDISGRIKHILTLDDQLAATHVKFIKSLGEILSPMEVARYMVFEQRFDREIRERIRMMMKPRTWGPAH